MRELKLHRDTGMELLKEKELKMVLDKTIEFALLESSVLVQFIYNVDLDSLSINFRKNNELEYWLLFQSDKLKQPNLRKLKSQITA